jgi:hypothetical protein
LASVDINFFILGSIDFNGKRWLSKGGPLLSGVGHGQVSSCKASDREQGQSFYNFLKILASLILFSEFNII